MWVCRLLSTRCNQFVQNFLFSVKYVLLGLLMHLEHSFASSFWKSIHCSSLSEHTKKKHKFFVVFDYSTAFYHQFRILVIYAKANIMCTTRIYSIRTHSGRREHNFDNPTLISGRCCWNTKCASFRLKRRSRLEIRTFSLDLNWFSYSCNPLLLNTSDWFLH